MPLHCSNAMAVALYLEVRHALYDHSKSSLSLVLFCLFEVAKMYLLLFWNCFPASHNTPLPPLPPHASLPRLKTHPKISQVHYPGLESHPGHAVAAVQMQKRYGGMLSFQVVGG